MIHFFLWEQVVFIILVIGSVSLFAMRFSKVWRNIQGSKDDPEFTIHPIGRRVRDFVWEVMLQGKVIRQRPLPGFAHALVFWGFCAFALVTINHFAQGVGIQLISRDGFFGRIYFSVAAAFAILVA